MCTHGSIVTNKFTNYSFYAPCRHCVECQTDKAAQQFARMMCHTFDDKKFIVFVTLNYSNQFLPYVKCDELASSRRKLDFNSFKIYRSCIRKVEGRNKKRAVIIPEETCLDTRYITSKTDKLCASSSFSLPQPIGDYIPDRVAGVAYSKDFTDFIKRFRVQFKRYYNIDLNHGVFSYYKVSEYGPTTFRPHFHALFFFPLTFANKFDQIRRTIIATWPFCSYRQIKRNIEVANKPQHYVSFYTVRPTNFPDFFKIRSISPKPSFTLHFGYGVNAFTPGNVEAMLRRNTVEYLTYRYDKKTGNSYPVNVRVPKYVINRYFPKFKGLYRLDKKEVSDILDNPSLLYLYRYRAGLEEGEVQTYVRRLNRARSYFPHLHFSNSSGEQYSDLWFKCHYLVAMDALKHQYTDQYSDLETYDVWQIRNLPLYVHNTFKAPFALKMLNVEIQGSLDPSKFRHRVVHAQECAIAYNKNLKQRKLRYLATREEQRYNSIVSPKTLNYG